MGPPRLALTPDPAVARTLALNWGVTPLLSPRSPTPRPTASSRSTGRTPNGLIHPGDYVVLVLGTMPRNPAHNAIMVDVVE